MATQQLLFDIFARSQGVEKTFDSIVSSADAMESKLGPTGQRAAKALSSPILLGAAAGIGAAVVGMGSQFGQMAAEAEQNGGAVETVFGSAAGKVEEYASRAANAVGLSASSYNQLSAVTGTALKSAGVPFDQLAKKNDDLITRGADLASVFGGTTAEAVSAMGAAFRGEFDPLERYGLTLTASQVSAELAARGQDKLGGAALEAAKKQATMDLIMQQSSGSAGNFAKEADTASGAQERQSAAWADAGAKLGEVLLPAMTQLSTIATGMATWVSQNSGLVSGFAIGVGILAGVIGLLSAAITIMNIAMIPQIAMIGGIVLAVAALIAIIVLLIANWDAVVSFITQVWGGFMGWLQGVMDGFFGWWNGVWGGFVGFISGIWTAVVGAVVAGVTAFVTPIVEQITGIWNFITGIFTAIGNFIGGAWTWVADLVRNILIAFVQTHGDQIMAIWNNIVAVFTAIGGFFSGIWNWYVSIITAVLATIWGVISSVFTAVWGFIVGVFSTVGGFIANVWGGIVGTIAGAASAVWGVVVGVFGAVAGFLGGVWNNIVGGVSGMIGNVLGYFGGLGGQIMGVLSGAGSWLYGIGKNIVEGLMSGISSLAGTIGNFFLSLIPGWIVGPFKAALGIASPSKVFRGFGRNIGEGVLLGVGDMQGSLDSRMSNLISTPDVPMFGRPASGPGSAGGGRDRLGELIDVIRAQRPVVVNGAPGQDEELLGRATAEQILWRG